MCVRVASAALLHVTLLLAMYGGAGLVTCARLKWDPTLYVVVRELAPAEFGAACAALAAAAGALLALAHLAAAALAAREPCVKRALLVLHLAGTAALLVGEGLAAAAAASWARAWLRSPAARELQAARDQLEDHLRPLLLYAARWYPSPRRLTALIEEVEADLPRSWHVACGAVALLVLLQAVSLTLTLLLLVRSCSRAAPPPPPPPPARRPRNVLIDHLNNNMVTESKPLKPTAVYRGGRLVLV